MTEINFSSLLKIKNFDESEKQKETLLILSKFKDPKINIFNTKKKIK